MTVLVAGAMIVSVVRLLLGRLPRPPVSRALLFVSLSGGLFLGSATLSAVLDPGDADNWFVVVQRVGFVLFIPLMASLIVLDRKTVLDAVEIGCGVGAAAVLAWTVLNLTAGEPRAMGGSGNPGPFATTCALLFAVCLLAALRATVPVRVLLFGLAAIGAGLALLASGMRTLYPFLPGMVFIAVLSLPSARRRLANWRVLGGLAVALVIVGLLSADVVGQRISALQSDLDRHGLAPSADTSLGKRIAIWTCAVRQIPQNPTLGIGHRDAMDHMVSCTEDLVGSPLQFTHYHNAALNALMLGGALELIAVIGLLVAPWLALTQSRGDDIAAHGSALLAGTTLIYVANGSLNVMFGHDIHDFLFIFTITVLLHLISGQDLHQPGRR